MNSAFYNVNGFFQRLPEKVKKGRLWVWLLFIAITIVMIWGATLIQFDNSMESFFQDDDPVKLAYDRYRADFGSDEILYIVYKAKDGDIFSNRSLRAVRDIVDQLENVYTTGSTNNDTALNRITDVTSIINVSYLEAWEDALVSRDFIDQLPENKTESEKLKQVALSHPDYPLIYVSEDGQYGGIVIRTDFNARNKNNKIFDKEEAYDFEFSFDEPSSNGSPEQYNFDVTPMQDYVPFIAAVRTITDKRDDEDILEFYYAGTPESSGFIADVMMKEMGIIILGSLLLIMLVLFLLFRSLSAVLWPVVIVIASVIWMMGTIGWSGLMIGDTVNIIVFLLIAVGVADAIHILSGYLFFRRKGQDHEQAIRSVYKKSGFACFLTSVTTATGLFAMTVVPIVSMQLFGIFAGLGVLYAFLITVVMLPLMMDAIKPVSRKAVSSKKATMIQKTIGVFERAGQKSPILITIISVIIGVVLLSGFSKIVVDSNIITIIREDQPIRAAYDLIDEKMAGTGNVEVYFDSGSIDGLKDPVVLEAINGFQQRVESELGDIVYKSLSLSNVAKDAFRVLNDGDFSQYIIPEDPQVLSQTLFLFDSANPKDRRLLVSDDYRKARITLMTRNIGSRDGMPFMDQVKAIADDCFFDLKQKYPDLNYHYTGQIPLFLSMMSYMSWAQIQSFAVTLGAISVILFLVFGSLRTGLVSIIPNLFPIVTVIGVMGYFKVPLDLHTLLVLPIVIGISVDDTIHFLTHFRLEYKKSGNVEKAISNAMKEAGQAIIFTSLVLAAGYLVFLIAVNKGFGYFGILCSIAVITATIADLLLLPALLRLSHHTKVKKVSDKKIVTSLGGGNDQ